MKPVPLLLLDFTRIAAKSFFIFFIFIFCPEEFLNCSCSQFIVIIPPCLFFCEFVEVGEEVVIMEKLFSWSFRSTPGMGVMYIETVLT